jgi:hypothetical protein
MVVSANVKPADIVAHDKDDVRLGGLRGGHARGDRKKYGSEQLPSQSDDSILHDEIPPLMGRADDFSIC